MPQEEKPKLNLNSTDKNILALRKLLQTPIQKLDLSFRTKNCLRNAEITVIGELVILSESDLFKIKNLGINSLNELISKLKTMGLHFNMNIDFNEKNNQKFLDKFLEKEANYLYNDGKDITDIPVFFNSISITKLCLFLGEIELTDRYYTYNQISNLEKYIHDIKDLKANTAGSIYDLLSIQSLGKKKITTLDNIVRNFYKNYDDLIEDLKTIDSFNFSNISCSNNLIRFLNKHEIQCFDSFVQLINSINFELDYKSQEISDSDAIALFEVLTINIIKKDNIHTSTSFFSKNNNLFQNDFQNDFLQILDGNNKIIFQLRFVEQYTLKDVGIKIGVTRERVRQICNKLIDCFISLYFSKSVKSIEEYLLKGVFSTNKPLTKEYLKIKGDTLIYSIIFSKIPFDGYIKVHGSTQERKDMTKYLSNLADFELTVKNIFDEKGIELIFYIFGKNSIYKIDNDGYIYSQLSVFSALDLIIRSIVEPTTVNEFRSYMYSNALFENLLDRNIFGKEFASRIGGNTKSVLLETTGNTLDHHIYGTINMIPYKDNELKQLHMEAIKLLKSTGHPMNGLDMYNILSLKFKKIKSKYDLAVMLKMSNKLKYTHRARAFIFSLKEHGKVKEVQEHFEDILLEHNQVIHISQLLEELRNRCSFREEGLSSVSKRNSNIILWGARYYGHIKNIKSDRQILKNDIEYIYKILSSRNKEKYFKLLFPDKKLTEIDLGGLLDG